ncbi:hypothetical protein [Azohydromonas aeria]|uniref:hypothetical protein n=1 Tax=Azohydromonas aeria TaxID=2590212 RepID=UPI0012FC08AE|nr:hypothetical protein [Azohydromonas aeria]
MRKKAHPLGENAPGLDQFPKRTGLGRLTRPEPRPAAVGGVQVEHCPARGIAGGHDPRFQVREGEAVRGAGFSAEWERLRSGGKA